MANANTDLTEEDAADLQFPKESLSQNNPSNHCRKCTTVLIAPYIYCPSCDYNLCTICFSNGVEFDNHKNDHPYQVMRDDFILFNGSDWTVKEESTLIDSLIRYTNWDLIARQMPNRTINEIKRHYNRFYLDKREATLPCFDVDLTDSFCPVNPYRQKITDKDEPPRYTQNTVGYNYLAGYNPARSDFVNEFDANAEDLVSNLKEIVKTEPFYDILNDLQYGIVCSYNRRLNERQRWKEIVRNHGLIALRKITSWLHRYDLTITRTVYEKLIRFMQFCTPDEFYLLMEGLHRSGELKIQISRLCELRQKGITRLADARLYFTLKNLHDRCENDVKAFHTNMNINWKMNNFRNEIPVFKKRSGFTPIEIIGMPGYDKLSNTERDLCKNIRLVPLSYLDFKEILVTENKKLGSLELKTARKLLKIDVNKTRRLYDFLVEEGYVVKPSS